MHPFKYVAASSVDEATSILAEYGGRARPLAGGTDLLVQLRAGRFELDAVVDVKGVPETTALSFENGGLTIGAAAPCCQIYENERVRAAYPGLIDAAEIVGGIQIQSRASLGGNLCNATPSADTICPMIVHDAEAVVVGPGGRRTVKVAAFCTGPGQTVLGRDEWLLELRLPAPPGGFGAAYERFTPRNEMDIAVAGVASSLTLGDDGNVSDARIALAAVGPTPIVAAEAAGSLVGKAPTADNFAAAAELARDAARPITDMRGTAGQRRHLVEVLARRTLQKALERAREAA